MPHRRPLLAALAVAVPVAALAAAGPAAAHHGWGGYDAQNPLTLAGTIERVAPQGAHATLWLRTADKTWEVVLAPPSRMSSRGLPATSLQPGQRVEVMGYRHREHGNELRAEWIRPAGAAEATQLR
jgi:Family of unknown function (DUF6152)